MVTKPLNYKATKSAVMARAWQLAKLNRRHLLASGIAGTAAAVVAALLAMAFATISDAKLLRLCRRWQSLERLHEQACARFCAAEDAMGPMPPVPDILKQRLQVWPGLPQDDVIPDNHNTIDGYGIEHRWLGKAHLMAVAEGRFRIEAGLIPGNDQNDETLVPIPEAARAKARECLAAHDQWEAARKARSIEVDRWDAVSGRLTDLQRCIAEQIAELPAHTMEGLRAKLALVDAEPLWAQETGIAESALDDMRRIDPAAKLHPPIAA